MAADKKYVSRRDFLAGAAMAAAALAGCSAGSGAKAEPAGPKHEALMKQAEQARWMLEEFYVSLWAQELGTKGPASLNRIKKALA